MLEYGDCFMNSESDRMACLERKLEALFSERLSVESQNRLLEGLEKLNEGILASQVMQAKLSEQTMDLKRTLDELLGADD